MKTVNWNNYNISKLCLGTVQFGLDYGVANKSGEIAQKDVDNILDFIFSNEINCLDTGSMYGNSERKIGNFIKKNNRENIKIVSKIKSDFFTLEEKNSIFEIDKSLNLLNNSTLFALLLHNIEAIKNWNIKNSNLIKLLKNHNKIKYFGVSIYNDKEFNLALDNPNVDIIQIPFNLFDQRAITQRWFIKAKKKNKLIFIRSIYLQGLILMNISDIPIHLEKVKKYITIIDNLSKKLNITKNELALAFVESIAKESIILFGCDSLAQAKENIEIFNTLQKLDKNTLQFIKNNLSEVDEDIYNPTRWSKNEIK